MSDTEMGVLVLGVVGIGLFFMTRRNAPAYTPPPAPAQVTTQNDLAMGAQAVGNALSQGLKVFQQYGGSAMAADQATYDGGY